MLRQAAAAEDLGPEMLAELDALRSARSEIAALRTAIKQVRRAASGRCGCIMAVVGRPAFSGGVVEGGATCRLIMHTLPPRLAF